MSIESDFKQLRIHLSRIADALEALLAERGYVPTGPTSVEVDDDNDNDDITPEQMTEDIEQVAATKTSKKKKGNKKKKDKNVTVIGKPDDEDAPAYDVKDVRKVLKQLQEAKNQASVKSLLKKYGASTLVQVKEKHYVDIIRDAEEDME